MTLLSQSLVALLAVITVVSAPGCRLPAGTSPPSAPVSQTPDAAVALAVKSQATPLPIGETSIQEVTSVKLLLEVTGVTDDSEVVTDFYAPGGVLYERRQSPLAKSGGDSQSLTLNLPVAGTHVQNFSLVGDWMAEITVAGNHLAAQPFTLTP